MKKTFSELRNQFPEVLLETKLVMGKGYMVYAQYKECKEFIGWLYPQMKYSWRIKNFIDAVEHYIKKDSVYDEVNKNIENDMFSYPHYSVKDFLMGIICSEAM